MAGYDRATALEERRYPSVCPDCGNVHLVAAPLRGRNVACDECEAKGVSVVVPRQTGKPPIEYRGSR